MTSHETNIFYAGAIKYILEKYDIHEDSDDRTKNTSIGRFHYLKNFMPETMVERIFDIYSHYDYNRRKEFSAMPMMSVGSWQRPDNRFLRTVTAGGKHNLMTLFYTVDDALFNPKIRIKGINFKRKGETLWMRDNIDTPQEEPSYGTPIQLFRTALDDVVPFVELTGAERFRLRESEARNIIWETWKWYKDITQLPFESFSNDTARLDVSDNVSEIMAPPSRGNNSIDEALTILSLPAYKKFYDKMNEWLIDPKEWDKEVVKRQKNGQRVPPPGDMKIETYQSDFNKLFLRDVAEYRAQQAIIESKRVIEERRFFELQKLDDKSIDEKYGVKAREVKEELKRLREKYEKQQEEEELFSN